MKLSYKKVRPDGEIVTKFKFVLNNESGDIEESKEKKSLVFANLVLVGYDK